MNAVSRSLRRDSRVLGRLPGGRLGLRARITSAFAVGALLLSALLSLATFASTRASLLEQRESAALTQAFSNAQIVRDRLPDETETLELLQSLQTPAGSHPIALTNGSWFSPDVLFGERSLPSALREIVTVEGRPARMRYDYRGETELAIGIPLQAANAAYFEVVDLAELEDTLRQLSLSLTGASIVTTLAGAALGWWASRRALRPLADVSRAAEAIAGGRLDTRLHAEDDPELGVLVTSFNNMAQALQARIENDARFASDVSHELRSPLMTLSAATEILETRRSELSDRAAAALDLLVEEVARFQRLVEDLLEISRFDAGAVRLELDDVRLAEFVMQAVAASGSPTVPVDVAADLARVVVPADKRRLGRVIANLLDNANRYGGGAVVVSLRRTDEGGVMVAVEDAGPGVSVDDRDVIFQRFSRGGSSGRRGAGDGVGLGLALVEEHVRLHGGRVWVEDRADGDGGARFVVELPVLAQ
ncbi:HAMP domain-containing sensor histidine kinase [soil metagenome]